MGSCTFQGQFPTQTKSTDLIGYLYPIQTLLGIKRFVPGISISFKYECYIQYTKNPNAGIFELGTTLS